MTLLPLVVLRGAEAPIRLDVDATEAPRNVLRVVETLPSAKGRTRLSLPKWIPGKHRPFGRINDVVDLHFAKGGRELRWVRDFRDPNSVTVDVPSGEGPLEVRFVAAVPPGQYLTPSLGRIKWYDVAFLPEGRIDRLWVRPSLRLPEGWTAQTALRPAPEGGYAAVTAERLVDSPVLMGRFLRSASVGEGCWLDTVADDPRRAEAPPETLARFRSLVEQTQRLFGARHFSQFRFQVALKDDYDSFGCEHAEGEETDASSGDLDPKEGLWLGSNAVHETLHSWNGKYRRPRGMVVRDFREPQDTELLWVYEGLTQYYGNVLLARAGFADAATTRDVLMDEIVYDGTGERGRSWRSVADTARSVVLLRDAPVPWTMDRRSLAYYYEMNDVWLEADATIRRLTKGSRSLDDFCRRFFGGRDTGPLVRPYGFGDVVAGLNAIAPYDWRGFLRERVYDVRPEPTTKGLEAAGWRVAFDDRMGAAIGSWPAYATFASGFLADRAGNVTNVVLDSPAYRASLVANARIETVGGKPFSIETLWAAFSAARSNPAPIRLGLAGGTAVLLDYHGGLSYPHLVRIEGTPDYLSRILEPRDRAPQADGVRRGGSSKG